MSDIWNAATYSKFLEQRTRPATDLLFAVPTHLQPKTVYDLGCGPGNSTILLAERWPQAKIIGLDSSPDMLQQAESSYPELNFVEGDISSFTPQEKVDGIFANAALQWVENHQELLPRLASCLNPGGFLAVQMPNNFHFPSHQVTVGLLQQHASWEKYLKLLRYGVLHKPYFNPPWYYDLLSQQQGSLFIWQTEYYQEMADHQQIFNWVQGTGLRPVLTKMTNVEQQEFAEAYVKAVSKEYPVQLNGKVILPYLRIFLLLLM